MSAYSFEVHASTAADLKQVSDVSDIIIIPNPLFQAVIDPLNPCPYHADE